MGVDDEYVEAVLSLVERIPSGRVMTYGEIAEIIAGALGRGGPRTVGAVMAHYGGGVPWWRVVAASGRLPPRTDGAAGRELIAAGGPGSADGARGDMRRAAWTPPDPRDHR
jgi:alkylated DNA nucleotide flippase Atl1